MGEGELLCRLDCVTLFPRFWVRVRLVTSAIVSRRVLRDYDDMKQGKKEEGLTLVIDWGEWA